MTKLMVAAAAALLAGGLLGAPKTAKKPARVWPDGASPKGLAIARIDVAFRGDRAKVTTDLTWPKRSNPETFAMHVAWGAPGTPRAFDAELLAVPQDRFAPELDARGSRLSVSHEPRAPREISLTLGLRTSAGETVIVQREEEQRIDTPQVALRVRAVHEVSPDKRKSVLVRIGPADATLDLGPITVTVDGVAATDARAELCDKGSHTRVALPGQTSLPSPSNVARRAGESLCIDVGP